MRASGTSMGCRGALCPSRRPSLRDHPQPLLVRQLQLRSPHGRRRFISEQGGGLRRSIPLRRRCSLRVRPHPRRVLIASRSALPGLNAGAVEAAMAIASPVRGLRPWRAGRFFDTHVVGNFNVLV